MLEEQISPIFGLTLMGLVEWVALAAIISGAAAVVGVVLATISLKKSANENEKQSKVSSSILILDLLKPWRTNEIQELFSQIRNDKLTNYDETKLGNLLNHLEDIAVFEKDGTLDTNHVKEFFGTDLKAIRDDKFIQGFITSWVKINPDYYFVNLKNLLKKVDEWKI